MDISGMERGFKSLVHDQSIITENNSGRFLKNLPKCINLETANNTFKLKNNLNIGYANEKLKVLKVFNIEDLNVVYVDIDPKVKLDVCFCGRNVVMDIKKINLKNMVVLNMVSKTTIDLDFLRHIPDVALELPEHTPVLAFIYYRLKRNLGTKIKIGRFYIKHDGIKMQTNILFDGKIISFEEFDSSFSRLLQ